ncbi:glycosyltransferase family 4 protein [Salinisphaera sp.]|uniref:glycosyltransferase family 4 protein n=1 Tax=Salinisphaera sp. TaxID=1914330 RepID=UPI002D797189|nr:glycosyltransferase family 4 protein [Salinisphaera sp.]HET7313649.1 glycosyltransferase family 4 protein [Salinisphaera sp.]
MNIRRVLLSTDAVGGVWDFTLELARGLSEYGVEVVLVTLGPPPDDARRADARAMPGLRLHESAFRLEWMQQPWADVACSGGWLQWLARIYRPDIVHLNQFSHGARDWPAPTVVAGHSCVCSWFDAVHGQAPGPEWRAYRQAVRRGLAGADIVTAPSAAMRRALLAHYDAPADLRVVYNGRRATDFPPSPLRPRILAVGRLWDPAKNLDALTRIADRLDWPVRLIGPDQDPDHGPEGRRLRAAGVEHRAPMRGPALAREFAEAGIYALPARYEPFGLSALEAALAGCALVLGDIPSLREIWGDAASYVPPDDDAALADVLQQLSRNPDRREQWARRARSRALSYSAAVMTRRYLDVYREASKRAAARAQAAPCESFSSITR